MDGHWVFAGGIERVSGKCFLVEVQQRDSNTLLPLIAQYTRSGSRVYSDELTRAHITSSGLRHLTVNHSLCSGTGHIHKE